MDEDEIIRYVLTGHLLEDDLTDETNETEIEADLHRYTQITLLIYTNIDLQFIRANVINFTSNKCQANVAGFDTWITGECSTEL